MKEVSKEVLNAKSAQSMACKRSVHVQEVLRRVFNTSPRLAWDEEVAPVLTDYMGRMYLAGYAEGYRRNILDHAFRILDQKEKKIPFWCYKTGYFVGFYIFHPTLNFYN